jgi:hypothetical protein
MEQMAVKGMYDYWNTTRLGGDAAEDPCLRLSMANVKSPLVANESPHLGSCSESGCCKPL